MNSVVRRLLVASKRHHDVATRDRDRLLCAVEQHRQPAHGRVSRLDSPLLTVEMSLGRETSQAHAHSIGGAYLPRRREHLLYLLMVR